MLLRYVVFAVLVLLAWYFLSRLLVEVRAALSGHDAGRGAVRGAGATGDGHAERLLPCAACGVRVPESRMLTHGGERYCSPECRRHGPRAAS